MMTMFWNLICVKFDWRKEKGEYFLVISSFEKEISNNLIKFDVFFRHSKDDTNSISSDNSGEDIPLNRRSRRTRNSDIGSKPTNEFDDFSLNLEWDRPLSKKTRGAQSRKRNG